MLLESYSIEETKNIAYKIAKKAVKGDIFCLEGELGAGKTSFSQGFAKGLGINDYITSPTFTIMNIYESNIPLYHFDVYRIEDIDEMYEIGYEEYFFGDGICLVEWSNLIEELIPNKAIKIIITKDLEKGEDYRRIEVIK